MKVCPYCRENIQDGSIKCRYCLSPLDAKPESPQAFGTQTTGPLRVVYSVDRELVRSAKVAALIVAIFVAFGVLLYLYGFNFKQTGPHPDQITYVVDQGLLRFAKVAGTVLAMFVTVGVFLYGFNLKEVAKEIREMAEGMQELHRQATLTNDEIRKSKDEVAADRAESEKLLKETRDALLATQVAQQEVEKSVQHAEAAIADFETRGRTSISALEDEFHSKFDHAPGSTAAKVAAKKLPLTASHSFTVPELARLYDFPAELDGSGECIALIELGGGYREADLNAYFTNLGIAAPKVSWVSVDGAKNLPSKGIGADSQVTLDIEVAGAAAPGAHIVVYFAPNTNEGFFNAVETAVADEVNRPSVVSISWGSPEGSWTQSDMNRFDQAFQAAAAQGITVVCAAGDSGVTDGVKDGEAHVDFPASSPWVLACGGTHLAASKQKIRSEVVWNDGDSATGGGVSNVFLLPDWQTSAGVPAGHDGRRGRGLPDVAASASPLAGYSVLIRGKSTVLGGTAAVAPLWAGLIALLNQGLGRRVGHINPVLYANLGPAGVLRAITEGNNGMNGVKGYSAGPGWNACTGWGSPNGKRLLEALRSLPVDHAS